MMHVQNSYNRYGCGTTYPAVQWSRRAFQDLRLRLTNPCSTRAFDEMEMGITRTTTTRTRLRITGARGGEQTMCVFHILIN